MDCNHSLFQLSHLSCTQYPPYNSVLQSNHDCAPIPVNPFMTQCNHKDHTVPDRIVPSSNDLVTNWSHIGSARNMSLATVTMYLYNMLCEYFNLGSIAKQGMCSLVLVVMYTRDTKGDCVLWPLLMIGL